MSAVDTLKNNNPQNFIARKYIDQVLDDAGQHLFQEQDRIAAESNRDVDAILATRSYSVTPGTLSLTHSIQERFADMRPRYKNYKQVPLHNTKIWGEFNRIAGQVAYGFTENIKALIAQQYNIDING